MFFWVFPRRQIVVGRRFGTLYRFHLQRKRNGTNILHTITWPPPDTLLLYLPLHTDLPTLDRPLPDASLPHWFVTGLVNNPGRVYITPCFLSHSTVYHQPLKMEPIQGSETSANYNLTPGKYPKEHFQRQNCFLYWITTFGPKKWKDTEGSTNLSDENLFKLHPTTNSIQVTL
jgi:hypothetical protein